ncbi:MAG TPA: hypothetical protein VJT09_16390 [Pyrinomonadaceae bacterium]|nr:hypothetical protein [Pyrinomonadaceae bacterium]
MRIIGIKGKSAEPRYFRNTFIRSRFYRRACLVISLFPVFILVACWIDGTLRMQDQGKGLTQHYGYWVIFVTTPVIFFLTLHLLDTFLNAIRNIDNYCVDLTSELRTRVDKLVQRHIRSLSLRSRSVWILVFIVVILLFWWLVNVIKTTSPFETYHHDVFDASTHRFGFYTAKVYSLLFFSLVYSVAIFVALHITVSMISILKFLNRHKILRIDLFHEDNCGGTSKFGNINLMILGIYANFFAVTYAMYMTHRQTYLAMTASLIACSLLAVAQSVAAVYYIHKTVAKKKRECIEEMTVRLNQQFVSSLQKGGRFPSDLLAFRNYLVEVHTYPYATGALVTVNVIRFAPAALALINYFTV